MVNNLKNGALIYTAGPIDLGVDFPNWREKFTKKLQESGVGAVVFDPSTAYRPTLMGTPVERRDIYIEHVNREALDSADIVVVAMPLGVTTVGTPIEIDMACQRGKTVMMFTNIERGKSVYLNNRVDANRWFHVDLKDEAAVDMCLQSIVNDIKLMTLGND